MTKSLAVAACALAGIGVAGVAVEISGAVGDRATDERTVQQPVHRVVIDAEDGDVTLVRADMKVHVRVSRNHLVNSPNTSQQVSGGVLTLKTRCPVGFVSCTSDYRVGVPSGVTVTVRKASGLVDASAIGGRVTQVEDGSPLTVTAQ